VSILEKVVMVQKNNMMTPTAVTEPAVAWATAHTATVTQAETAAQAVTATTTVTEPAVAWATAHTATVAQAVTATITETNLLMNDWQ
jgi:hypothetical protein